jgi:hypothetical protein
MLYLDGKCVYQAFRQQHSRVTVKRSLGETDNAPPVRNPEQLKVSPTTLRL